MTCPHCHHANPADARFCTGCGQPLALLCLACQTPNTPDSRFCKACGTSLAAPPQLDLRAAAPQSYTPRHLTEKILTSRSALEGERKQVTVLFCDLTNSTGLAERLGPEAMHALLNRFFALALAEVHSYEGTINQFLGDGFMALFGAPVAVEDHARRAALAALGIHKGIQQLRTEVGLYDEMALSIRIGMNTGLVSSTASLSSSRSTPRTSWHWSMPATAGYTSSRGIWPRLGSISPAPWRFSSVWAHWVSLIRSNSY
jgi:hypothetical protein